MTAPFNIPRVSSKVKATTVPIPQGLATEVRAKALAEGTTIKAVAAELDISLSTLNLVLNGRQQSAKPSFIKKLQQYVEN